MDLSYETIRVYLKRVYEKLHVHSRTEAVLKYRHPNEASKADD